MDKAIDTYRALAFLLATALFGVCGFLVSHFHTISPEQFIISCTGLFLLFVFLLVAIFYFFKMMAELEKSDD